MRSCFSIKKTFGFHGIIAVQDDLEKKTKTAKCAVIRLLSSNRAPVPEVRSSSFALTFHLDRCEVHAQGIQPLQRQA